MIESPRGLIDIREVLKYLESDRYLGKCEAAQYLGLGVRTLEARKDIPRFRLPAENKRCGKVLFKKSELDRWMEANRITGDEQQDLRKIAEEAFQKVCGRSRK